MLRLTAYGSVFLALTAMQLSAASTAHAVPNDTIAQAAPLEPRKPIRATNVGAVTEPVDTALVCSPESPFGLPPAPGGVPPYAIVRGQQASVWWRFRRGPRTTVVSTAGSTFKTTLAVWRRTPGGPPQLIACDKDRWSALPSPGAAVYLQRQRGRRGDHRVVPDPPGTEYFAQVGGCVGSDVPGGTPCGAGVGNIRVGVYEGLDETLLDFRFFFTRRYVQVKNLRLTHLPRKARLAVEWLGSGLRDSHENDYGEKSISVRRRTFDARRLTGPLRLRTSVSFIRMSVTSPGRVGKFFDINPVPGKTPRVSTACLFPDNDLPDDCLYRKTRYREPKLRGGVSGYLRDFSP